MGNSNEVIPHQYAKCRKRRLESEILDQYLTISKKSFYEYFNSSKVRIMLFNSLQFSHIIVLSKQKYTTVTNVDD